MIVLKQTETSVSLQLGLSTIESSFLSSSLGPDLQVKDRDSHYKILPHKTVWTSEHTEEKNDDWNSYPESVIPGPWSKGCPIGGHPQRTDTVLMSKQNRHSCSLQNIPNIYSVVIVATKK